MQRARAFFFVSLGILALALAFHLGARSSQAQSSSVVAAAVPNGGPVGDAYITVVAQNGDVWAWRANGQGLFLGNVFSGAPISTQRETWGRIKADRR